MMIGTLLFERSPDDPQYITTETGVGYRLREADPEGQEMK
jgi:two-component system KDP operon response regulator KdpE